MIGCHHDEPHRGNVVRERDRIPLWRLAVIGGAPRRFSSSVVFAGMEDYRFTPVGEDVRSTAGCVEQPLVADRVLGITGTVYNRYELGGHHGPSDRA